MIDLRERTPHDNGPDLDFRQEEPYVPSATAPRSRTIDTMSDAGSAQGDGDRTAANSRRHGAGTRGADTRATAPGGRGLRLAPFRGLRYDPSRVSSLGNVTSPPYDVIEPAGVLRLEDLDPYNIVRLILPREDAGPPGTEPAAEPNPVDSRYRHAASALRRWIHQGVLRADSRPALYLYEQTQSGHLQRGIIGALDITPPQAGIVLPHEDVVPAIVADRTGLMRSAEANHDPLLLAHRGFADNGSAESLHAVGRRRPVLETTTPDGVHHRLWALTDPAETATVAAGLAPRRALIADGHHRWATYLRLQRHHRETHGPTPSSWDRGLVLLVDTDSHPLRIQPIHRVLPHLPIRQALDRLGNLIESTEVPGPLPAALKALDRMPADANAFLLSGGTGDYHLLSRPTPQLLRRSVRPDRPMDWRNLDVTVLHRALITNLWQIPDDYRQIHYSHDAAAAEQQARTANGTAVLLRPIPESVVRGLAEQGVMLPRKSTSFGPKPATGLVLRDLTLD
jgi:uncharacterized protein (DUF1015 family)